MIESVDLRRLHVLRLVHRYGTVTAAADLLHLTPSAVSHQIRQLSRETGTPLLEPDGRRVRLTAAGRTLVGHADALHARWEEAQADLAAAGTDGSAGLVRLCGFPTAVAGLLAPAAQRLQATCPRLAVRISESETAGGFDLVLAGAADIAIVVPVPDGPPLDDAKFDQQPLLEEPVDLLAPPDHPLVSRDAVTLADAAREPWVLAAPGSCDFYQIAVTACTAAGFTPNVAHQAKDWASVCALVARGLGIALVPRLAQLPAGPGVVRLRLAGTPAPVRRILTCVRRGSGRRPVIRRGLETIQEVSRQLPQLLRGHHPSA